MRNIAGKILRFLGALALAASVSQAAYVWEGTYTNALGDSATFAVEHTGGGYKYWMTAATWVAGINRWQLTNGGAAFCVTWTTNNVAPSSFPVEGSSTSGFPTGEPALQIIGDTSTASGLQGAVVGTVAYSVYGEVPCVPGPKVVNLVNDTPLAHEYQIIGYGPSAPQGTIVNTITLAPYSSQNVTVTTDGSLDRFQVWLMWDNQHFGKVDEWTYAEDCDPQAATVSDDPTDAQPGTGGTATPDDPSTNPDPSTDAEEIVKGLRDFPVAGATETAEIDETAGDTKAAAISAAIDTAEGQLQGVSDIPVPELPVYSTAARKYVYDANVQLPGVGSKNIGFNVSQWSTWIELFRSMIGFLLVFLSIRKAAEILRGAFSG